MSLLKHKKEGREKAVDEEQSVSSPSQCSWAFNFHGKARIFCPSGSICCPLRVLPISPYKKQKPRTKGDGKGAYAGEFAKKEKWKPTCGNQHKWRNIFERKQGMVLLYCHSDRQTDSCDKKYIDCLAW